MTTAAHVAGYLLSKLGELSTMKLQTLVYYIQAWSLVWDDRPLFSDRIEAWANGPVCPSLYASHRGKFSVTQKDFPYQVGSLTTDEAETVDAVIDYYGDRSAHWLSVQTHNEEPWIRARQGCQEGAICTAEITHASMAEYYSAYTI